MDLTTIFGPTQQLIPDRNPNAITGSQFIQQNLNLTGPARDANVLTEVLAGNFPSFMRNFKPITVSDGTNTLSYLVSSDVICIGSDMDFIRIPIMAQTGKKILNAFGCSFPTKKIADQIWQSATIKLQPMPKGSPYTNDSMQSTQEYSNHNSIIQNQLNGLDHTQLITGHKKDYVLGKALLTSTNNICIYGWFDPHTGIAIQGCNSTSHDLFYFDYSQAVRMVSNAMVLNNQPIQYFDLLNNSTYCSLISDEGNYNATNIYN